MSNNIKISRELASISATKLEYFASRFDDAFGTTSAVAKELRALLAQTEMWNPHPAEAHLASLLIVLGSAGIKVSGGTHGDPWTVAAPVVERQKIRPVAYKFTRPGHRVVLKEYNSPECYFRDPENWLCEPLYAEQPAPVAVDEKQALQDRHEAWMAGAENGKASVAVVPLLAKGFTTLESIGGKYKIVTGFENRDDAWAAYDELCRATIGIDKVKELNQ